MESINDEIHFLPNPKINPAKLDYIKEDAKNVYANLFEIQLTKDLKLYQYPYSVFPDIGYGDGDMRIRNILFKVCSKQIKEIYGECFISGDSLYSMKKIEEKQIINNKIALKKLIKDKTEYFLEIQKYARQKTIKQEHINSSPLAKQFIELLIKDILHANPKLEFYKGLFVLKKEKKTIKTQNADINFYPGLLQVLWKQLKEII